MLIDKEFEILKTDHGIPGRLITLEVQKISSKKEIYKIPVFYGSQWGKLKKEEIQAIQGKVLSSHKITDNNIIIGDFNFVEMDIDKGKGMDNRDKMVSSLWGKIKEELNIIDLFREKNPKRRLYSFVEAQGKSRGDRLYCNEENIGSITKFKYTQTPFKTAHKILSFEFRSGVDVGITY